MLDRIQSASQQAPQQDHGESWVDKARREASLIGEGLSGFADAARDAFTQHKAETAAKVAVSCGVGLGLAYLSRGRSLGPIAARSIGVASGLAFAVDVGDNAVQIAGAIADTARSDANFDENAQIMRKSLGKFAFDTALMSAAGLGGSAAGHGLFNVRLGDLPAELVPQMNARGISQDYYNKLFMVDRHINVIRNVEGKYTPDKVARSYQELPGSLQKLVTYRQYWNNEFANYKGPQPLDQTAAMNVLLNGNAQAIRLNKISAELAGFQKSDLTDVNIQERLYTRVQAARGIIYDK
ncbi:MAG: hypothetical protein JST01_14945 [Cyanobacteria bacterium SZAS TMP-1]|nr:hypothetical protein [Cyanobacteria bacterium SZAS TMP-1]